MRTTGQNSYSSWNTSTSLLLPTEPINPLKTEIELTCHALFLALFITVIFQRLKVVCFIICSRTFQGLEWIVISTITLWFLLPLFFLFLSSVYSQRWFPMVERPLWLVSELVKTRFHEVLLIWRYLSCLNYLSVFSLLVRIFFFWHLQW